MPNNAFRGTKTYRPWYLFRTILNQVNHRIARRNIGEYPQLAIYSFDNIGLVINLDGRYEADSLEALSQFLTTQLNIDTDTAVLDIGANIGNHSVFFSGIFNRVFAFEPNPQVYRLLSFNSEGSNIVPLNYGLSSENSLLTFAIDSVNLGGSKVLDRTSNSPAEDLGTITVEVRRLDDEVELRREVVSLIKIDVEGHEIEVLRGATDLIETARPVIVFEQGKDSISEGSSEVIDFLRRRNYGFFTIRSNFYLGRWLGARIISVVLRSIFGFRRDIVRTEYFETKFYEMIIAVPHDFTPGGFPSLDGQA